MWWHMWNIPDVKPLKWKYKNRIMFCNRCSFTERPAHLIYDAARTQWQNIQAKKVIPFSIVIKTKYFSSSNTSLSTRPVRNIYGSWLYSSPQKWKFLHHLTHPHVVPNVYEFLSCIDQVTLFQRMKVNGDHDWFPISLPYGLGMTWSLHKLWTINY